ncbi:MAG: beta-lactamase family protein [Gammaproteobacteria bacterium]|nr:beta-lactamase family protein [Gammaproteobacteria bacterium]MBU2676137.1 beta-lactamase family protein [Gammaproteobacteria bacterium]NNC57051.1 serine hydrolase [Woeseiaceae bacterium]NNL49873.1 serine hydrolase [Woeseiaceae bacterium]
MNKTVVVIAAMTLVAALALTQIAMRDADAPGIIIERLARIDSAINTEVEAGEIPGAVALIVKNGEVVYHKSFGFADIDSQSPMQPDSIFRIASMTKSITTVAAMVLYEQGHFRLNDPVARYIPEFAEMSVISEVDGEGNVTAAVPATKPIKIIDLMTHSSGIGYPFIPSKAQKTYYDAGLIDGLTIKDLKLASQMKLLAAQPLLFEPGSEFAYGLSTDLLGYLVEVVSGKTLDRFFADEIFEPLGMDDTHFYLPESKYGRLVTLYNDVDGVGLVAHEGTGTDIEVNDSLYPVIGAKTYFSGGAGLSSTAEDYALFLQMLLNDGELNGARILGRKSVELMRTGRVDWDGDDVPDFGLGFAVVSDVGKNGELASPGTYAWGGAFDTSYWIDPEEKLIGVYMSQARPTKSDLGRRFSTLVYQALE